MNDKCLESTGFLTVRRCDRDAVQRCSFCGKPVCSEHGPKLQSGQISCVTCMRERGEKPAVAAEDTDRAGDRKVTDGYDTYSPIMYYDTWYGDLDYRPVQISDHLFTESDHSALAAEAPDKGRYESDFEGS